MTAASRQLPFLYLLQNFIIFLSGYGFHSYILHNPARACVFRNIRSIKRTKTDIIKQKITHCCGFSHNAFIPESTAKLPSEISAVFYDFHNFMLPIILPPSNKQPLTVCPSAVYIVIIYIRNTLMNTANRPYAQEMHKAVISVEFKTI